MNRHRLWPAAGGQRPDSRARRTRLRDLLRLRRRDAEGCRDPRPSVAFSHGGIHYSVEADFIVGADGFHGVCRSIIPQSEITSFERHSPFAWLGILANVAPSTDELIYALHPDGFAMRSMRSMHSMHSPEVSRHHLQVDPEADIANWSDERIWEGLHKRLGVDG